jgi:hypothetical protein
MLVTAAVGCGPSSAKAPPKAASGLSVPPYLPAPGPVNRVLEGSVAHPTLGIEGDTISITVPSGHATAVLVGPQVPESGAAPIPNYTDALFQLTLTAVTGTIPLSANDFTLTDEIGRVSHPQLIPSQGPITTVGPVPTGAAATALGPVPAAVATGQNLVIDLADPQIGVGDGRLAWGPGTDGHQVATWDFAVEVD